LLFFAQVEKYLSRYKTWKHVFDKLFAKTRERATEKIQRYEVIGLMFFVAIPLPVTGAWTGALIAYLFGLDLTRSLCAITAGVLIAGLIVLSITLGVVELFKI
jgi:uncharacterized membrane protein